jgi:hypothetical protein
MLRALSSHLFTLPSIRVGSRNDIEDRIRIQDSVDIRDQLLKISSAIWIFNPTVCFKIYQKIWQYQPASVLLEIRGRQGYSHVQKGGNSWLLFLLFYAALLFSSFPDPAPRLFRLLKRKKPSYKVVPINFFNQQGSLLKKRVIWSG